MYKFHVSFLDSKSQIKEEKETMKFSKPEEWNALRYEYCNYADNQYNTWLLNNKTLKQIANDKAPKKHWQKP